MGEHIFCFNAQLSCPNSDISQESILQNVDEQSVRSLNSCCVADQILRLVPNIQVLLSEILITCITWLLSIESSGEELMLGQCSLMGTAYSGFWSKALEDCSS
jgi:hypothetical protein